MVKRFLLLALFAAYSYATFAQAGSLDTTFNVGLGFDSTITTFALQPDGKIIVGGNFTHFNGISRNYIARLNSDGSLDATFVVGSGFGIVGQVNSLVIQPSGKIVVAGNFYRYNSSYCGGGIARLNSDGSLDTTFIQGNRAADTNMVSTSARVPLAGIWIELDDYLYSGGTYFPMLGDTSTGNGGLQQVFQQSDGSIIANVKQLPSDVTGNYGYASFRDIFRCSGLTGVKDISFLCNSYWFPLAQQSDGKIIFAGGSQNINRMNINGTLDGTFNLSTGSNNPVNAAVLQPDGHIILGGAFTTYDGVSRNYITRVNTDRSQDGTFSVGTGFNLPVNSLALQSDGKVIVGGNFITYNSVLHNRIARLNSDASIDTSFITGTGFDSNVNQVQLQPDGKILVSGTFTNYNGVSRNKMARINAVDTTAGASGIQSISFPSKITISPNPAQGVINITSDITVSNVTIQNILGQVVYSNSFNEKSINVDVQELQSGMYFMKINNGRVYKIVKQ